MNYAPADPTRSLHDTWIFIDGDDIHLFYLSPLTDDPTHRLIGHARSCDWLHWEELSPIELTDVERAEALRMLFKGLSTSTG